MTVVTFDRWGATSNNKIKAWKSKLENWKANLDKLERALDPNQRPILVLENMDKGLEWAAKFLKLNAKSLTSHPYFVFHKLHFEVLATALDATNGAYEALEAIRRYDRLAAKLDEIPLRANRLKGQYNHLAAYWRTPEAETIRRHWIPIVRAGDDVRRGQVETFDRAVAGPAAQRLVGQVSDLLQGYLLLRIEVEGTRNAREEMFVHVNKAAFHQPGSSTIHEIGRKQMEQYWYKLNASSTNPLDRVRRSLQPLRRLVYSAIALQERVVRSEPFWVEPSPGR